MTPRAARDELIRIQKRLVNRIKREIRQSIGPEDPRIARYYHRYQKAFRHFTISDKPTLTEAVAAADIVYNGDYHTLRQSQKIPIRILTEVVTVRPKIILCLEMVMAQHQEPLDRYMKGSLDDNAFLQAIQYEEHWGFPWPHYKVLFDFAREHHLRVVALNNTPKSRANSLATRDRDAAKIIAALTLEQPDALIYVIDGDLHLAREHLPADVERCLTDEGAARSKLLVFHNAERIYWRLAAQGNEEVDVVRLADDAFCVMNTTPVAKFQSYLNWVDHKDELETLEMSGWADEQTSYTDQLLQLVRALASFLGIEAEGLDDFTVYTTGDLDFLNRLRAGGEYSEREIDQIREQILRDESYFIPHRNILYLANLSVNHAAEEASHFIHHQCAGTPTEPMTLHADFYFRTLREALGFLGSKIINHKRTCYKEKDFEDYLVETYRRRLGKREREVKQICELAVQHKRMERAAFSKKKPNRLKNIYRLPTGLHLGVTHALGYMLGDKMYYAILDDELSKEEVRTLFHDPFDNGHHAFTTYMILAERMDLIHERCFAKDVCL